MDAEGCRRLACDAAVTQVVVSHHPTHHPTHDPDDPDADPGPAAWCGQDGQGEAAGLESRLRAAVTRLSPKLGGSPAQPLDLGRSTRLISPGQRTALAARDGGCVVPDCARPLSWCEGHHLISWLDGGPTDLANLALLCRAQHRAVHDSGWQLTRDPDGRFTAIPPHRRSRQQAGHHRRQPARV